MNSAIKQSLEQLLQNAGATGDISFTVPPKPEMGDASFACFAFAKLTGVNPAEAAKSITEKLNAQSSKIVQEVKAIGPYVNFFLNGAEVSKLILKDIGKQKNKFGTHVDGKKKKVLVEYGCPNPLKAFHLGHLRNLVTGESVTRVLGNAGYKVVRTNYQGDVGMHVAKTLWGISQLQSEFDGCKKKSLVERITFLGKAYAYGAQRFEDPMMNVEIVAFNRRVYEKDKTLMSLYKTTRKWSLDYFETIYKKLGVKYNAYYFESEMYKNALVLINVFLKKDVFKKSEGAIIFPGSAYGLHDRVFVNSEGFPTYEAKDVALASSHFSDYHPSRIIHVVGKEQTEYFKVVFKAIESVVPESVGKEVHLVGGYLQLKGDVKMSSRTGNVITGDALIEQVRAHVETISSESEVKKNIKKGDVVKDRIAIAALKYTMLKTGVSDDIAFDMQESVSTTGDSGPYLLYIVARIKSILRKAPRTKIQTNAKFKISIEPAEKQLVLKLAEYPEATKRAADELDPSQVAKYVFGLAQTFNTFYHACPVLQAEGDVQKFRLQLIRAVEQVMENGLSLLGIETVDEM